MVLSVPLLEENPALSDRPRRLSLARHQVGVAADVLAALRWRITAFRSNSVPHDIREMLNAVLDWSTSLIACDAAGVYVFDSRRLRVKYRVIKGYTGALARGTIPEKTDDPVSLALLTGRTVCVELASADLVPGRPAARSRLVVPIVGTRGLVIGAIDLISDHARSFDGFAVDLLTVFAAAAASSIDSARLHRQMTRKAEIDRDLSVARELVEETASSAPLALPGFDVHVAQQSSLPVGGDYSELLPVGPDRWFVCVADVSGKGVSAALLVSAIRALMRSSAEAQASVRESVQRINRFFRACGHGHFVTAFFAELDTTNQTLTYINAGHHPPILVRPFGIPERLDCSGLPLGFFDASEHPETQVRLGPGDLLAIYTDGIVEPTNGSDEQFGDERLVEALRARAADSKTVTDHVLTAIRKFAGSALHDDRTIVVMRSRPHNPTR